MKKTIINTREIKTVNCPHCEAYISNDNFDNAENYIDNIFDNDILTCPECKKKFKAVYKQEANKMEKIKHYKKFSWHWLKLGNKEMFSYCRLKAKTQLWYLKNKKINFN